MHRSDVVLAHVEVRTFARRSGLKSRAAMRFLQEQYRHAARFAMEHQMKRSAKTGCSMCIISASVAGAVVRACNSNRSDSIRAGCFHKI